MIVFQPSQSSSLSGSSMETIGYDEASSVYYEIISSLDLVAPSNV